jgi:hypothetical protein
MTEAVKKKISDSLKGQSKSEETRKKMSEAAKNRKKKPISREIWELFEALKNG